jgi:hypothetical protein
MMDGLLMFEYVTLEIWRKLFLASRNPHAQSGRNLWHVESNSGIFICINPFFYCPIFSKKKILKLKLNFFQGFNHQKSENRPVSEFFFSYVAKTMEG